MKIIIIVGIILITLGVIGLIYGGITYTSSRNTMRMGDIQVQVNETEHIPMTPIAGALAVIAGTIILIYGRRV